MDSLNVSSASATGNPRNKVSLKPGRSLMDWIRLTNSSADLSGTGNRMRDVSIEELAQHNKQNDAWIAIRGMVYNVTSYFEFHPGGEEELLRGAGIDATDLFDQVHKWVNYESMLKKCLIGRLKAESVLPPPRRPPPKLPPNNGFLNPSPTATLISSAAAVTTDWMQTATTVTIVLYTRQKGLDESRISASIGQDLRHFHARIFDSDWLRCYDYGIRLTDEVDPSYRVTVSPTTGKVELVFGKRKDTLHWNTIGEAQAVSDGFLPLNNRTPTFYRQATITSKTPVTHNVYLFTLTWQKGQHFYVPVGWHVQLKLDSDDGSQLIRSYTPVPPKLSLSDTDDCSSKAESSSQLHFLIKIYSEGPFTSALDRLTIGSSIEVSHPIGNFAQSHLASKSIVAIAAGTGITPMIRVIIEALRDDRNVSLIFFNRTKSDIIWKEEFRELQLQLPDKFQVLHVLSEPDDEWKGLRGRISQSILTSTMHFNSQEILADGSSFIGVCGPSGFNLRTLELLDSAEYKKETIHAFAG